MQTKCFKRVIVMALSIAMLISLIVPTSSDAKKKIALNPKKEGYLEI